MYPFADEDTQAPDTANVGADNVPTAPENTQDQGAGDYFVGPMGGGAPAAPAPMPQQGAPAPPSAVDPATIQALQQRLQQALSPETRFQQIMRMALPAIAGAFAPSGTFGSLMNGYTSTLAKSQLEKSQQAQEDLRLAAAIKDLQMQERAQSQLDARAKQQQQAQLAAQAKAREGELKTRLGDMLKGGLAGRLNTMIDNGEDVQTYLNSTMPGENSAEGSPLTVGDLMKMYGQQDPDGVHFLDTLKSRKEIQLGSQDGWVQNALAIAQKNNGGTPLTEEMQQAVAATAIKNYKDISKDPDDQETKRSLRSLDVQIKQLHVQQLQAQMANQTNPIDFSPDTAQGRENNKVAEDLASGKLDLAGLNRLLASRGGSQQNIAERRMAIYLQASSINPDFNPKGFEMNFRYASSPQTQRQLVSINKVERAIPGLLAASDAASRTGVKAINENFVIPGGVQIGDSRYSDLKVAQKAFADELSLALGVGNATDMKTKMGVDMTDTSLSPDAFRSSIQNQVAPFLQRAKEATLQQSGVYGQPGMNPSAGATNPLGNVVGRYNPATGQIEKP